MGNKIKYGLKNVHYAVATFDNDGNVTYSTPVKIPGAVNLELDADGDLDPWYIDNTLYAVVDTSKGYTGSLEMALIPESFSKDVLHDELDENYAVAETVNDGEEVTHFALMFQFDGDVNNIRHVMYNCICTHPAIASSTREETKDPQTDTLNLIAGALPNGYVKMKTSADTPNSIYNYWFQEVYTPNGEAPASFTVYFYNGTTLLQTVRDVPYGGSATYTGSTPVCKDDPNAEFLGWDPKPTNITKDTRCYAQFDLGTYTVRFYNGSTLLQTVTGVSYGGTATYTGSTPINSEHPNLVFTGWDPEPTNITADTDCYAQFEEPQVVYIYVASRSTIYETGEIVDDATITVKMIESATGEVAFSATQTLPYTDSVYTTYGSYTFYDKHYDSWSDVRADYEIETTADGYYVILTNTMASKNSAGNFNLWVTVINLSPVDRDTDVAFEVGMDESFTGTGSEDVTIEATEISTGTKVYSQTKSVSYGGSTIEFDTWTVDGAYLSFSSIENSYTVKISVKGYSQVGYRLTTSVSGGVIHALYMITGLV